MWPHGLLHTSLPCPSPTPRANTYSNSCPSSRPSNHLILRHPLLLLPSIFPSIRVFSNETVLHIRWPKYWSFSFSISPSIEYSGLISFRIDWLDHLAIQRTLFLCFCFFVLFGSAMLYVGSSFSYERSNSLPTAVEGQSLNWIMREVPGSLSAFGDDIML